MSARIDGLRCYDCKHDLPEKDVWYRRVNGGNVTICPTCWSRFQNTPPGKDPRGPETIWDSK